MVRLIGIPKALGRSIERLLTGGVIRALWIIGVTIVFLTIAVLAFALGGSVVGAIAGIILSVIYSDEIAAIVSDTYERRWYKLPHRYWPW